MISTLLERFRAACDPGPFAYPWCHHHPGTGQHHTHVVVGCLTHGNEHGTLPAALEFVKGLRNGEIPAAGPVTVLLGNTRAALRDERFLEEDFNRVFTFDRPAQSAERQLAEQVRPILDAAALFLDIHQTQTPTEKAFWTFPWSEELGAWARVLQAAPVALTRQAGQVFSRGTCCLDEYVRGRGQMGITVEVGYRGQDAVQSALALATMKRLVQVADAIETTPVTLSELALRAPEIQLYRTAHIVPAGTANDRLRAGLCNWTRVNQGELLSVPGSPRLVAPAGGYILFPKYPKPTDPPPPELYRLAQEVTDLTELQ